MQQGAAQYRVGFEPEVVTASTVREFYDYWCKVRGDRRFPSKADIEITAIPRLAGGLLLLKVHRDPLDFDFRWRDPAERRPALNEPVPDLCGPARVSGARYGAFDDFGGCLGTP